jgi:hypothetical protein
MVKTLTATQGNGQLPEHCNNFPPDFYRFRLKPLKVFGQGGNWFGSVA